MTCARRLRSSRASWGAEPERDERPASDPWQHSVTAEVFDQEVDIGGGSLVIAAGYELRWRERMKLSVDTLGRWLIHRAAELDALRANAAPDEGES